MRAWQRGPAQRDNISWEFRVFLVALYEGEKSEKISTLQCFCAL